MSERSANGPGRLPFGEWKNVHASRGQNPGDAVRAIVFEKLSDPRVNWEGVNG